MGGRSWTRGAVGRSVRSLGWLGLWSRGGGGGSRGRRTGSGLRGRRAGSRLSGALARRGRGGTRGSLAGVRGARLAVLLVLDLLEVLLAGPHLGVLELLHVEGLAVGEQLLPLVFQLPSMPECSI